MTVVRYQQTGIPSREIEEQLASGNTVASVTLSPSTFIDIDVLPDETGALDDLNFIMADRGYAFVGIAPAQSLEESGKGILGMGINAYDTAGGLILVTGSDTNIVLNAERTAPGAPFTLNPATGVITATADIAWADISYGFSVDATANNRSSNYACIHHQGVEVPGTRSYTYSRNNANGEESGAGHAMMSIASGETIALAGRRLEGTDTTTIANGSRLSITILR